jgi:Domain of unknown function (DUF4350)
MTSARKLVAALVAALVALNILVLALGEAFSEPGGPTSSSYATAPDGLAAYADLVRARGHGVTRLRESLDEAGLEPRSTLVLLDPREPLSGVDARAVREFVRSGGRVVAGGAASEAWITRIVDAPPPAWSPEPTANATTLAPGAGIGPGWTVESAGAGSWSDAGSTLPVLGAEDRALVVVAEVGRGTAILLADASPVQNALLGTADNAAFALAAVGEARDVVFVESVHGYGEASGIRAIPTSWKWTLGGLLLAALALIIARGRRLGPPERESRELPPPRRAYVDSLAGVLARTRRPSEAIEPLRRAARARVAARASLDREADDTAMAKAAARIGLADDEIRAVFQPAPDGSDILAAGRAFARLEATVAGDRGGAR